MQTTINIRTDKETKEMASLLFEELGLSLSGAINIFLKKSIKENGLPFELKEPNFETIKAIKESDLIAKDKTRKRYKDIDELRKSLGI